MVSIALTRAISSNANPREDSENPFMEVIRGFSITPTICQNKIVKLITIPEIMLNANSFGVILCLPKVI